MAQPDSCYVEKGMLYCERRTENGNKKKKGKTNNGYRGEQSSIDPQTKGKKIRSMTVC